MGLKDQLNESRFPNLIRNRPGKTSINPLREKTKQLARESLVSNRQKCKSFTSNVNKAKENNRQGGNREIGSITLPGQYAFYVGVNLGEIKVKKTSNHDFEAEYQCILEQIPLILEKDEFHFSDYFPRINSSDSSETIPKKATKTYVQKIFQLLFSKMYSIGIKPDNHTSKETRRKRDAGVFLKEKFGLGSFPTHFPTDIEEKEEHFQKQPKDKR